MEAAIDFDAAKLEGANAVSRARQFKDPDQAEAFAAIIGRIEQAEKPPPVPSGVRAELMAFCGNAASVELFLAGLYLQVKYMGESIATSTFSLFPGLGMEFEKCSAVTDATHEALQASILASHMDRPITADFLAATAHAAFEARLLALMEASGAEGGTA